MGMKPNFQRGGRGLFCDNMHELIKDANDKGLNDLDISQKLHVAQSTVRNWYKTHYGDKKLAIKLYQLINSTDPIKSIQMGSEEEKSEKIVEIERLFKIIDSLDIDLIEILKEGILKKMKE